MPPTTELTRIEPVYLDRLPKGTGRGPQPTNQEPWLTMDYGPNLIGTFEGPWSAYLELAVPRWVRSGPAERFFHLLHSVPASSFGDALRLAVRRNAGSAFITDRGGANPWDGLPAGEMSHQ